MNVIVLFSFTNMLLVCGNDLSKFHLRPANRFCEDIGWQKAKSRNVMCGDWYRPGVGSNHCRVNIVTGSGNELSRCVMDSSVLTGRKCETLETMDMH